MLTRGGVGQTLGFALAKGLIRGLTRCQPAVEILTYYLFLDVSWWGPHNVLSVDVQHVVDHRR